jgi:hypothetical protein
MKCGNRYFRFPKTAISSARLSVSPGEAQFFEQLAFCLLHAARRLCIAEGAGDALQGVDTEPLAQVLCRFIQRQQGLQRRLVTLVTNAFAGETFREMGTSMNGTGAGSTKWPNLGAGLVCL